MLINLKSSNFLKKKFFLFIFVKNITFTLKNLIYLYNFRSIFGDLPNNNLFVIGK